MERDTILMQKKIKYIAIAGLELIDTVKFYNRQSEGLGYEFTAEIKRTLGRILHYPKAWNPLSKCVFEGSNDLSIYYVYCIVW